LRVLHAPLDRGLGIVAGEAAFEAVVEGRRDHLVPVGGIAVAEFADVVGDAEDLLDQQEAAAPGVVAARPVGVEFEAVVGALQADGLAHGAHAASNSSSVRWRARSAASFA
jgi:hypothetical protein